MITTKILVDFRRRKVVAVTDHRGSSVYTDLIQKGYVEAAVVKSRNSVYILPGAEPVVETFITSAYFDPKDKYS